MNRMIVPTKAETDGDFIGPLNPHVGRFARLAPGEVPVKEELDGDGPVFHLQPPVREPDNA